MTIENIIDLASIAGAIFLLVLKRKGMKKYVPVALFAFYWAIIWCEFAEYFGWWSNPIRSFPYFDIPLSVDFIVVPIMAMFWVRYAPSNFKGLVTWNLFITIILSGAEYLIVRYTNLLEYGDGFYWYYSFLLWFISWFVWYGFHVWFYRERKVQR
ncbi:MAG: hypothetical protein A4E53_01199 [Pelotomaculum sp. PtaB.Bin104]|nr:MAG: hypothetical protein A4E53_01199 [Pelotomaculum sp. PtaB.Bin104]